MEKPRQASENDYQPAPVLKLGHTFAGGDKISSIVLTRTPRLVGAAVSFLMLNILLVSVAWLFIRGWVFGGSTSVAWGFAIINLVW
jgi:hypothetical protein